MNLLAQATTLVVRRVVAVAVTTIAFAAVGFAILGGYLYCEMAEGSCPTGITDYSFVVLMFASSGCAFGTAAILAYLLREGHKSNSAWYRKMTKTQRLIRISIPLAFSASVIMVLASATAALAILLVAT